MKTQSKTSNSIRHRVYIGLGSNLGDSLDHVTRAVKTIEDDPDFTLISVSHWYRSKAVGPGEQSDYVNGALLIETALSAIEVLDKLQAIELQHQRKRIIRWGPRTLDLDILMYGDQVIHCERLTIPHPEIAQRNFVMQPLVDLTQELALPDNRKIVDILAGIGMDNLHKIPT